jgi:DNA (cytosine-5)-methyltransferase 1
VQSRQYQTVNGQGRVPSGSNHPNHPPRLKAVLAADLFAGAGGFSKAAKNVGIQVKVAVEQDAHACETYRHNFIKRRPRANRPELVDKDITSIELSDISSHFGMDACDLVLGGPPCQGFSVHRTSDAGVDDPRNLLIHRYFEVVAHLKPKVFLMENVPGILWKRHAEYLELFYAIAKKSGYRVHEPAVLDARDFGVPQRRKRVFILGIASDLPDIVIWPPAPSHGNAKAVKRDKSLRPWIPCTDAFLGPAKGDENNVHMQHTQELVDAFARTPANGGSRRDSGRLLKCHVKHDGHKDVYGRIDSYQPAPTMTTACINPSKGRFVHPTQNHGITARQAARIQTFPDEFTFFGGLMAAGIQIGNAVPVTMGEAILRPIRVFIESQQKP